MHEKHSWSETSGFWLKWTVFMCLKLFSLPQVLSGVVAVLFTLYAVGKDHVIEWHIWMMTSEGTILIHYRSVQIQKVIIHKYCCCRSVIGRNTTGTLGRVEPQRLGRSSPRRLSPAPYQEQQPLPAEQNDQPVRVSTSYIA